MQSPLNELLIYTIKDNNLSDEQRFSKAQGLIQGIQGTESKTSKVVSINWSGNNGDTALHWAAWHNRTQIVELLIGAKADLNIQGCRGFTPLICAARQGHLPIVMQLIQAQVELNVQDDSGDTAVHWAAFNANPAITKALIKAGADLNTNNNARNTPVDEAVRLTKSSTEDKLTIVSLLLEAGARFNHPKQLFVFLQECNQGDPRVLASLNKFCRLINPTENKPSPYSQLPNYLEKLRAVHGEIHAIFENSTPMPKDLVNIILDYDNPFHNQTTFLTPSDIERLYVSYTNPPDVGTSDPQNDALELPQGDAQNVASEPPQGDAQNVASELPQRNSHDAKWLIGFGATVALAGTLITGLMAKDQMAEGLFYSLLILEILLTIILVVELKNAIVNDISPPHQALGIAP